MLKSKLRKTNIRIIVIYWYSFLNDKAINSEWFINLISLQKMSKYDNI